MIRTNLHIYPSPFKFESRILRETKSIIELGLADKIVVASGWSEGLQEYEEIDKDRTVKRFKLFFDKFPKNPITHTLKYIEFILKIFFYYYGKSINSVNCHSLFVLPVGYLMKIFNNKTWLIYDAHELESQKTGLSELAKRVSTIMERIMVKKINKLIVVSPSIAKWYEEKYGLGNVIVLRNTPELLNIVYTKKVFNEKFNIPPNQIIFIYQGVINIGRGIDILLNSFKKINTDKHLVIMGYGPLTDYVIQHSLEFQNIHYMPAVPPNEIPFYTSAADIGISLIENVSLSYYYCLPNKLFEYIHCGLPVIVSDFPDMGSIVKDYNCGWTCSVSSEDLITLINKISLEELTQKKAGAFDASKIINWQNESKLLQEAYPQ